MSVDTAIREYITLCNAVFGDSDRHLSVIHGNSATSSLANAIKTIIQSAGEDPNMSMLDVNVSGSVSVCPVYAQLMCLSVQKTNN